LSTKISKLFIIWNTCLVTK